MNTLLKRWRLLVVALVTAMAVLAGNSAAFAAEPGEDGGWSTEMMGGQINSPDTYSEARSPSGVLVGIYRGFDNRVWVGVNNSAPFAVGGGANNTQTNVAPRVVYMDGWFYAFHTGTDNRIYWSRAFDGTIGSNTPSESRGGSWSAWTAISGDPATTQSVSVAVAPGHGLLMTWLGVNQTAMYSAWLQSGNDVFNATQSIPHNSNSAPVVAYSTVDQQFILAYRGLLDNRVYITEQGLGESGWFENQALGTLTTPTSPTVAVDSSGDIFLAAIDFNNNIWYAAINAANDSHGWSMDTTGEESKVALYISVIGSVFWVIANNWENLGLIQYKVGWNAKKGI